MTLSLRSADAPTESADLISVIIPAHNEVDTLPRLLRSLASDISGIELLVVCNGCTDGTAGAARSYSAVRVLELDEASKHLAMVCGLDAAQGDCVVFLDADVRISAPDLRRLVSPLRLGDALAAAPRRSLERTGSSWLVCAYYDVWERLPQVRTGLFGRGVIALTRDAANAFRALPPAMSDDLAISECIPEAERVIVAQASVSVALPRTLSGLLRRRTRVVTGNAQADREGFRAVASHTRPRTLWTIIVESPRLAGKVAVFAAVAALARLRAARSIRSGDVTTWLRDDSRP